MNAGGEAADQLVKMYLSGGETLIRLTGSLLRNLIALMMAMAREHKQVLGKINLAKMLQQTRDLRTFTMTPKQYKAFEKLAKKQGILFAAVKDKDGGDKRVDVILPATEVDRANVLFERIAYDPKLGPDSPDPPQSERKHWWNRFFRRRDRKEPQNPPNPSQEAPSTALSVTNPTGPDPNASPERWDSVIVTPPPETYRSLPEPEGMERNSETGDGTREETAVKTERTPVEQTVVDVEWREVHTNDGPPQENAAGPETSRKDESPSRPDSPDTRSKSTSPARDGTMTSERPSVLARLAAYRAIIEQRKAVPEKGRDTETPTRDGKSAEKPTKDWKGTEKPNKGGKRLAGKQAAKPRAVGKGGRRLKAAR